MEENTSSAVENAPEPIQSSPDTQDKSGVDNGQATDNSNVSVNAGQAGESTNEPTKVQTPEIDDKTQNWMQSKGLTYDSVANDPMKVLQMAMNSESHMNKTINEYKQQQESKNKLDTAKQAAPIEHKPDEPVRPSEKVTKEYETAIGHTLYALGVQDVNELHEKYPQDQYPAIYNNLSTMYQQYQANFQKAVAEDVDFLMQSNATNQMKSEAEAKLEQEWQSIKKTVNDKFETVRKENPKFDEQLKDSGVSNLMGRIAATINVPIEYVWHDPGMFDFARKAAAAITFLDNAPELQKQMKQEAIKTMEKQKTVDVPSTNDPFLGRFQGYNKAVSLLD